MSQSDLYYEEIRKAVEADYLLLDKDCQNAFQLAYSLDRDKPDFSAAALPQLWAMEIFILRNLSKKELVRRMWILREKFRLQAGESIYTSYSASLPQEITDSALKQDISEESFLILKEDAVNITRQMQRMTYYRAQRNIAINKKKEVPIVIFFFCWWPAFIFSPTPITPAGK